MADRRPLYVQVKEELIERLIEREWKPGDILPNIQALADRFNVSHGTMRKALGDLENAKLIERWPGRGTFVAESTPQLVVGRFFSLRLRDGTRHPPISEPPISCRRGRGSKAEQKALALDNDERVIRIQWVRHIAGEPTLYESIVVPERLFPRLGRAPTREIPNVLYQHYEKAYGIKVTHTEEELTAVNADAHDALRLHVPKATALLQINRIAYGLNGKPVEWRISRCSTEKVHYFNRRS